MSSNPSSLGNLILCVLCFRVLWTLFVLVCIGYFMAAIILFMRDFTGKHVSTKVKVEDAANLTVIGTYNKLCEQLVLVRERLQSVHSLMVY